MYPGDRRGSLSVIPWTRTTTLTSAQINLNSTDDVMIKDTYISDNMTLNSNDTSGNDTLEADYDNPNTTDNSTLETLNTTDNSTLETYNTTANYTVENGTLDIDNTTYNGTFDTDLQNGTLGITNTTDNGTLDVFDTDDDVIPDVVHVTVRCKNYAGLYAYQHSGPVHVILDPPDMSAVNVKVVSDSLTAYPARDSHQVDTSSITVGWSGFSEVEELNTLRVGNYNFRQL